MSDTTTNQQMRNKRERMTGCQKLGEIRVAYSSSELENKTEKIRRLALFVLMMLMMRVRMAGMMVKGTITSRFLFN